MARKGFGFDRAERVIKNLRGLADVRILSSGRSLFSILHSDFSSLIKRGAKTISDSSLRYHFDAIIRTDYFLITTTIDPVKNSKHFLQTVRDLFSKRSIIESNNPQMYIKFVGSDSPKLYYSAYLDNNEENFSISCDVVIEPCDTTPLLEMDFSGGDFNPLLLIDSGESLNKFDQAVCQNLPSFQNMDLVQLSEEKVKEIARITRQEEISKTLEKHENLCQFIYECIKREGYLGRTDEKLGTPNHNAAEFSSMHFSIIVLHYYLSHLGDDRQHFYKCIPAFCANILRDFDDHPDNYYGFDWFKTISPRLHTYWVRCRDPVPLTGFYNGTSFADEARKCARLLNADDFFPVYRWVIQLEEVREGCFRLATFSFLISIAAGIAAIGLGISVLSGIAIPVLPLLIGGYVASGAFCLMLLSQLSNQLLRHEVLRQLASIRELSPFKDAGDKSFSPDPSHYHYIDNLNSFWRKISQNGGRGDIINKNLEPVNLAS